LQKILPSTPLFKKTKISPYPSISRQRTCFGKNMGKKKNLPYHPFLLPFCRRNSLFLIWEKYQNAFIFQKEKYRKVPQEKHWLDNL
jgi:hypothetical protein